MGRGKRTALAEGTGRHRRLPDVLLSPPPLELELLLGWSYQSDASGRSALPEAGDSGTVALENVAGDEMVRLYIAGQRPYMTYPSGSLYEVKSLLRSNPPARCAVVAVDDERSAIVVAVSRVSRADIW